MMRGRDDARSADEGRCMSDANRYLPPDPATLRADAPPRTPLGRAEKIFAWSLVFNGALGLLFIVPALMRSSAAMALIALPVPLVGVVSGVLALRGKTAGFFLGTLFYLLQCVKYYAPAASFGFVSGIQFGVSFHPVEGETIAVNLFAIIAFVYGMVVLNGRWSARPSPATADAPDAGR
jgi:hypothetical protein